LLLLAGCGGGGGDGNSASSGASSSLGDPPPITVSITPTSASVAVDSGGANFSATVGNSTNTAVTWQVDGITGGDAAVGTITTSGAYSAPQTLPSPPTVTVTAVAVADPTKSAAAAVTLMQPAQPMPTVPNGLSASGITATGLTLGWAASSETGGSIAGYYVYRNGALVGTVTGASYVDSGLVGSTGYNYQVAAFDGATPHNVSGLSAALNVVTAAAVPTAPTALVVTSVSTTLATISWSAASDPGGAGIGGYYVYRNGVNVGTSGSTSFTDAALTGASIYSYQVAAFDMSTPPNVSALSSALSVTTPPPLPTVPAGLSISALTATSLTLNWSASSEAGGTGVGGYYVYRNGTRIGTVSGTSFADAGLMGSSLYSYQVAAFDKASTPNVSGLSAALAVTTAAPVPSVPAGLSASSVAATSVSLSWSASTEIGGPGVGGYYVYRNGTRVGTATNTSFSDSGLLGSSLYSYQIAAFDKASPANVSALSVALAVTTAAPVPTVPTGLAAANVTATGLSLSWSAATEPGGTGVAGYYLYRNGTRIATVTSTAYADSGLQGSSAYSYQLAAFDNATPANVSALSSPLTVTTAAPVPTAPTGLAAANLSVTGLSLSWTASTEVGGTGIGGYYIYRNGTRIGSSATTTYVDAGLLGSTRYSYQVAAFDKASTPNVSALSAALSVTTPAPVPTVPTGLSAASITASTVSLSWSASSEVGGSGIGGYYVYRNGTRVGTASGTTYVDSGLTGASNYSYQVAAFDKASTPNVSALSAALAVTTAAPVPTVPIGLAASNIAATTATLNWTASTEAGGPGIAGYYVYRNGALVGTTAATTFADSGLTPVTSYSYQVAAFDKAATPAVSALSTALSVTTTVILPTVPSGLAASSVTTTTLTLSWTASTDVGGSGLAGYSVYRNGIKIATTSSPSYNDTGLTGSTTYSYQVAAYDSATPPNASALSSALSVTTAAPIPTVPTGLSAGAVQTTSVALSWSASSEVGGPGIGGYYVYRNGARIGSASSTAYTDTGLQGSTPYSYQVAAFDKAATPNVSALSGALAVTTAAPVPSVPTGLIASAITATGVTLSWNASTEVGGPGIAGYQVYRNGTSVGTPSATSFTDSSLAGATTYSYRVAAVDKATPPNASALSSAVSVTTSGSFTITPRSAALTLSQTQQYSATVTPGTALNWSVDGVAGGNSSVGTISSTGLYTAPASGAGTHTVTAASATNASLMASVPVAVTDLTAITTYHADLARTGQNLQEYALTPSSVSSGQFGKRWSCPVDGAVYAQPLYVANLLINGGTHNVLLVATMHDSLYAFDADNPSCVVYWQVSFINPSAGVTTQSSAQVGCQDVQTEYGIMGTPVIDPVAQTIYLVANTSENGSYFQRLHALSLGSGTEQSGSPATITASVSGSGDGGSTDVFDPIKENQRPGLLLTGGGVYIGWSAHCDLRPFHGWFMRYEATTLTQTAVFNVTPNGYGAGIWMSAGAPAVDSSGGIFLSTGNGTFDDTQDLVPPAAPGNDFGMSVLNLNASTLAVQDYFTPYEWSAWSNDDYDISASGLTVLPDGSGPSAHPNLLFAGDKQGHVYLIDRSQMSQFNVTQNNVVQFATLPGLGACGGGECLYSTPTYWNGTVYVSANGDHLMALPLTNGLLPVNGAQIVMPSSQSAETYNFPAPTASLSASPSGNAIVWVLDNSRCSGNSCASAGTATLRAYDATNLGNELYSSASLAADAAGNAIKFTSPVIANGHVYVGGDGVVTVYGLAP
jgi:chitodextrinase